jgi:hypothetical protein
MQASATFRDDAILTFPNRARAEVNDILILAAKKQGLT